MGTVMAILSQLFWGVTVGALGAAFGAVAKAIGAGLVLIGGGYWVRRWRTRRIKPD